MPYEITELELMELSIVDEPANPGARAVLFKRDDTKEIDELVAKGMTEEEARDQITRMRREQAAGPTRKTGKKEDSEMSDIEKRLADAEAINKKLKGSVSTLVKTLSGEGYVVEAQDDGGVTLEKRSDEDFIEVGGERILKSAVPAGVLASIEKQGRDLAAMQETLEKADLAKRADAVMGNMGGDAAAKGAILKAIDGIADEEVRKSALGVIESANKAVKASLLKEHGHTATDPDDVGASAQAELDKMAEAYAAEKGVSKAVAFAEVTKSGKGLELFNKRNAH